MGKFQKYAFLLVLSLLLSSCNNDETSIDPNPVNEADPPEISVSGITQTLEVISDINVKVIDESTVQTEILLDGEQLYTSSSKEFDYSFNPYTISVGPHSIEVLSKDDFGNENSKTFDVDIKHLLMVYNYGEQENTSNPIKWIFFNDLDGTPLANLKSELGITKIYTDKIITNSNIYYSIANYTFESQFDFKDLRITTNKIGLGKDRLPIIPNVSPNLVNEFVLDINLNEPINSFSNYWSEGSEYRVTLTGGGGTTERLGIKFGDTNGIYVRKVDLSGISILNTEPENYRYLKFTPATGYSEMTVNEEDFIEPQTSMVLSIPTHDPGTLYFLRYGYSGEPEIETNTNHLIFNALEDSNFMAGTLNIPNIEGLDNYLNILAYNLNEKRYIVSGFNELLDLNMPDWSLNAEIQNTEFTLTANNPDVDLYVVPFFKTTNTNGTSYRNLGWNYRIFGSEDDIKSSPKLLLPNEITDTIGEDFFKNTADLQLGNIYAIDYELFKSYDEIMDWLALIQVNPRIDELDYRRVSFPFTSTSRKNNSTNSFEKSLLAIE